PLGDRRRRGDVATDARGLPQVPRAPPCPMRERATKPWLRLRETSKSETRPRRSPSLRGNGGREHAEAVWPTGTKAAPAVPPRPADARSGRTPSRGPRARTRTTRRGPEAPAARERDGGQSSLVSSSAQRMRWRTSQRI